MCSRPERRYLVQFGAILSSSGVFTLRPKGRLPGQRSERGIWFCGRPRRREWGQLLSEPGAPHLSARSCSLPASQAALQRSRAFSAFPFPRGLFYLIKQVHAPGEKKGVRIKRNPFTVVIHSSLTHGNQTCRPCLLLKRHFLSCVQTKKILKLVNKNLSRIAF